MDSFPLILTKFHRPFLDDQLVARQRLIDFLQTGFKRRLTLVSAPAGYGKTMAICQWLDASNHPSVWLSLDEHDDDLVTCLTYFTSAIQTLHPDACAETRALLHSADQPPLRLLVATIVNELAQIPERFTVVLDDIHLIRTAALHDFLNAFLRHLPRSLHLVLTSRVDPPLDLISLRAHAHLCELRSQQLCFTPAETATLLTSMFGHAVDDGLAKRLTSQTEGWITGLRLAIVAAGNIEALQRESNALPGERFAIDFLVAEALERQPVEIRESMVKASILDRFCGPLMDAICASDSSSARDGFNGDAFINFLRRNQLFLISLDDRRTWYRFHHLFQQVLRQTLERSISKEETAQLHNRAAIWFADADHVEEAIEYALAAGNIEMAISLVKDSRHSLMDQEQWRQLDRWLRLLEPEVIHTDPDLLMAKTWVTYYYYYDLTKVPALLDAVDALVEAGSARSENGNDILAEVSALRSHFLFWFLEGDAGLEMAQKAMARIPDQHECVASVATVGLAGSLQLVGQADEASEIILSTLRSHAVQHSSTKVRLLFALCIVQWLEGDLDRLLKTAQQLLQIAEEGNLHLSSSYGNYYLGLAYYERNELSRAVASLSPLLHDPYRHPMQNVCQAALPLALAYQGLGQSEEAAGVVDQITKLALERHNDFFIEFADVIQVELRNMSGRNSANGEWLARFEVSPPYAAQRLYIPQMTYARTLLAENRPEVLAQVSDVLDLLYKTYTACHARSAEIKILTMQSIVAARQGEKAAALEKLNRAVRLSETGGWLRLFLDLGPEMTLLLEELRRQDGSPAYVARILAGFEQAKTGQGDDSKTVQAMSPNGTPTPTQQPLVEPLTDREYEVLTLLAKRLSYREIAAEMTIASTTVKTYVYHIYQKLSVNNRRQAIHRAQELGILETTAL